MSADTDDSRSDSAYISTGELPAPKVVQAWVDEAYARYRDVDEGRPSDVYPALAAAPADQFGICVMGIGGRPYVAGDADVLFTIMSVSKPFVFALMCDLLGAADVRERLGANSTGLPFNSLAALERFEGVTNPMVNAWSDRGDRVGARYHGRRAVGVPARGALAVRRP